MQPHCIIYTYYPFNNNNSKLLYKNAIKIQKWYKYYHIPHIYYHKNNEYKLVLTKYNMIKMLILYLKHQNYNYFKDKIIYLKKNIKMDHSFIHLYKLSSSKYNMYIYLKKFNYNSLKKMYLYIKYL